MVTIRANANGAMYTHFDPEGNASVLTNTSALSLFVPAEHNVHLYASFDSAWEQAVVIYVDGERYEYQMGSYVLRPNVLAIPKRSTPYELTLVAWHKRSDPNPALPWVASRGQRIGPVVFAWDDSAEDGDYRDTRVKLVTS
jgi:hypothetical protein